MEGRNEDQTILWAIGVSNDNWWTVKKTTRGLKMVGRNEAKTSLWNRGFSQENGCSVKQRTQWIWASLGLYLQFDDFNLKIKFSL